MNQQAKAKREFPYVTLILVVTLVLVVAILGYTFVDSIGLVGRLDNAAKSNTMKLNENHLDVYRYHVAQNELYYQYMYIQYGMMDDPTGGLVKQGLMDAGTFINYMLPSMKGSASLDASAYAYAEQYLTYCEGAKEAGMYDGYLEEVKAEIETYIDNLKTTAEAMGTSLNSYLKDYVGTGVSKGDVETAMEYYYIAGKYAEHLQETKADEVKLEEIDKYVADNKASFYTTKYTSYKLANNDMKTKYNIDKCTTVEEVKTVIVNYYLDKDFESTYETKITKANVTDAAGKDQTKADVKTTLLALYDLTEDEEVFKSSDTDAYKKAAYGIVTTINSSVKTQVNKVTESSSAWADPKGASATDLQKWMFADGRQKGDYNLIETKASSSSSSSGSSTAATPSYTWYIIEETMVLDVEKTKNAYYILLSDDAEGTENAMTATQKGDAFFKALSENKTAEKFGELVEQYAPGYSAELIEQISEDTIKTQTSEDIAKWLYDKDRKQGDAEKFAVKKDTKDPEKVTGVYVFLYDGENEETWKLTARNSIANEWVLDWYEEAVKKYNVVIDYEPETTAAATTAKTESTTAPKEDATEPTTQAGTEAATEAATEAGTESATEAPTSAE